jgi:xylulokinase
MPRHSGTAGAPLLLGVDVGTTGAKTLLLDERGGVLAAATVDYPLSTPRPLWAEQNPEDWWDATAAGVRRVCEIAGVGGAAIGAVGLTGQMHGLTLLDDASRVLRPAILWNDQRSAPQCRRITEQIGFARLLELTGNPVLPGFTAPKIVWVRENEPDVYRQARHFLLPKDYVRFRLTGEFATEVSDASGTSLFDVAGRRWSAEMFAALDIPEAWAPRCAESPEISGRVSPKAAASTGLAAGTPVVGGGGDQAAQAIGAGLACEGLASATLGTSGVVFAPTAQPAIDPQGRLHAFCHAVPGLWHVMGVMLAAGGSLRWLRDCLGDAEKAEAARRGVDPYEVLTEQAATAPPGCEGLLFLPYLSGERTPHPDPHARGAFIGLTLRHGKPHLVRAVLEGVAFGLRDGLELIRAQGIAPREIRASGGGARSPLWRSILADVFLAPIVTLNVAEGAAYGAALLAGVGAGVFPSVAAACEQTVRAVAVAAPDPSRAASYDRLWRVYRALYPALKPTFDNLADAAI